MTFGRQQINLFFGHILTHGWEFLWISITLRSDFLHKTLIRCLVLLWRRFEQEFPVKLPSLGIWNNIVTLFFDNNSLWTLNHRVIIRIDIVLCFEASISHGIVDASVLCMNRFINIDSFAVGMLYSILTWSFDIITVVTTVVARISHKRWPHLLLAVTLIID